MLCLKTLKVVGAIPVQWRSSPLRPSHLIVLSIILVALLIALGRLEGGKSSEQLAADHWGSLGPSYLRPHCVPLDLVEPHRVILSVETGEDDTERTQETQEGAGMAVGQPTAPRIEGEATWYHRDLQGDLMRDGKTRYDYRASGVVAAVSWPLGTILEVRGPTNRWLTVIVSDTGYLKENHVDLSEADFLVLVGSLGPGRIEVRIREVP